MPSLVPDSAPGTATTIHKTGGGGGGYGHVERVPPQLNRMDTDASQAPTIRPSYSRLESD
jgi:hypothetical protein